VAIKTQYDSQGDSRSNQHTIGGTAVEHTESKIENPKFKIATAVIIPALNEAGNVGRLVEEVRATLAAAVIVVDNGSSDGTAGVAAAAGAKVVTEPRRGYGYACAAGVAAAGETDVLVFMDGDRSFRPAELPDLLRPIAAGQADLVLGSRARDLMEAGAMPLQQRLGNWLTARLMRLLYGLPLTDAGPFRAVRRDLLVKLNMREMTFGWPTEMVVKAARRGARIVEVPVSYRQRRAGQSKVSGTVKGSILAGWHILKVTLRYARGRA
jgi:glycosyltransferase involved in cell wall biosynthesis